MSAEGQFYALSRYDVRGFLIEPASVDPYLQRKGIQGGPNADCNAMGQWQALLAVLPEIADSVVIDGTPALHCWVWPADRVADSAKRLETLPASTIGQRVQAWQARPETALGEGALDKLEALRQLVRLQAELRRFWQEAAVRRDAVLLYVV